MPTALTRDEYLATFVEPMWQLESGEVYRTIPIGSYIDEVIGVFGPPVSREGLEIHDVYLNGAQTFYHVLIHYGPPNKFLVIVVDCERETVHGHYLLDLEREYGLSTHG